MIVGQGEYAARAQDTMRLGEEPLAGAEVKGGLQRGDLVDRTRRQR